jgi:uncharacterized SAM-binding protein YcdF (DUF218 family)
MRRRRRVTTIVVCVIAAAVLAWWPRAGDALVVSRDMSRPQVIVALASHEWERLPAAASIANQNPESIVLLTQPRAPTPENCNRCSERVGWLVSLSVNRERIAVAPRLVANTYDEAEATRQYCERHGTQRLLVVTSPYHTRRALATFESVFAHSATSVGIAPAWNSSAHPQRWWSTPYDRWYVRYEWAALVWYALRHQVYPWAAS